MGIHNSQGLIVDFLEGGKLPQIIDALVSDSIQVLIASAFLNTAGVALLEKYLTKYDGIKTVQILLDENFHPDEQTKTELLTKLTKLPKTEVRLFCDDERLFHAKIYLFKCAETVKAVVGSSNLTAAGLFRNIEVNTLVETSKNDSKIQKLEELYNSYWEKGKPAKDLLRSMRGEMSINFKIGDKVYIGRNRDYGIGKIVDIVGSQVDIYFKERGIAETAHIQDIHLAMEPFDMAKTGNFDEPIKYDLRTQALYLPIVNVRGILSNSIIEILPHQILAAHKVIMSSPRRYLLADEVGLGKTFEMGIIIKELVSRGEASKILIITPAGLIFQWQDDMEKFGLEFTVYQSGFEKSIRDFWNKMTFMITSIDTIKLNDRMDAFMSAGVWDIIVFDEAHHLTRKDYGDKADKSDRYRVAEYIHDKADALFFLTATPHQGDTNKFFNLISLLEPDLFQDERDLIMNRSRLNKIMIRQRKIDILDEQGNPLFVKRIVTALRYVPSANENEFYDMLKAYLMRGYKIAEQDLDKRYRALGFVMTTFQKIAASSIYAVKKALEERFIRLLFMEMQKELNRCDFGKADRLKREIINHRRHTHGESWSDDKVYAAEKTAYEKYITEENIDPLKFVAAPDEIELLRKLLGLVPDTDDTKLRKLLENIKTIKDSDPNEKIIVFTEYLDTQDYIVNRLRTIYGLNDVVFIRGGKIEDKVNAAKSFKKTAHFLVSTQAGGEGINLQHCHIMVNYDMPWNPMKVEQRIGRIHRYKQSDTVQVYNLFAADTIEDRIYQRLDDKLQEITQTIGKEDEREAFRENILGIVVEELNFEELYKEVLKRGKEIDVITQERIDAAIERAREVYEKLADFTQDLERFSLEKYFKTKGTVGLKQVEDFVLNFVRSENKRITLDEEGNYEFLIPEIVSTYGGTKYSRITFDREKAVSDETLNFMALGHYITDSIVGLCSGYEYGGRCSRRVIINEEYKGVAGLNCNYILEYHATLSKEDKSRRLRREFKTIVFDEELNYRPELDIIATMESQKKIDEKDYEYADASYIERAEKEANSKILDIVNEEIQKLQLEYPNANIIFKKSLDNISLFIIK